MEATTIDNPMGLRTLLESVKYAMSRDATRCNLNTIQLERDGDDLLAIATDGHRLACHRLTGFPLPLADKGLMVGPRTIKAIQKTLRKKGGSPASADFGHFNNGFLMVAKGRESCEITPHDSDGVEYCDFPNWRQVVPKNTRADEFCKLANPETLAEDLEALADLRPNGFVKIKLDSIKLTLSTEFELKGGTIEGSATHDAIGGTPTETAVTCHYMAAAIRSLGGAVTIRFDANAASSIMLRAGEDYAVIMPMRL